MIDFSTLSSYFEKLRTHLDDNITLTIGNMSYSTSRVLLISHSTKLTEYFGNPQIDSFTITENLDPHAFEGFIEFVNNNKISFNKYNQIDKLYEIADFYEADLFRNYIITNIDYIDYQFNQISVYENQAKPTDFLIEKLSERIIEIVDKWENAHNVDLEHLLPILKRADLSCLTPKTIYTFCMNSMKFRKQESVEILKLFNLSMLSYQDLLKLQKSADEYHVSYDFFKQLNEIEQKKYQLQAENDNLSQQLIIKNKTSKLSVEFKALQNSGGSITIQANPLSNQNKSNSIVLIVGKQKVGKTTLINKYYIMKTEDKAKADSLSSAKSSSEEQLKCSIDFLDFPDDSSIYETIYSAIFKVQMILFVCSPDIEGSVEYCRSFYQKALEMKNVDSISSIVYWNKIDLEDPPIESFENAGEFAKSINANLISSSAKTGENVLNIYNEVFNKLYSQYQRSCFIC